MFLNGKNHKDSKDNSSNASKKVDADVHRKEERKRKHFCIQRVRICYAKKSK